MAADLRFQAIYTFNTLISMVTLIIDSCCDFVKTSEWTPRGGLKLGLSIREGLLRFHIVLQHIFTHKHEGDARSLPGGQLSRVPKRNH